MLALLFAAMAQAQEADSVIEQAEAAVASKLKDPESAHFTDVTISDKGNLVCGWVNAKIRSGATRGSARSWSRAAMCSYAMSRTWPLNNRGIFAITWNACRPLGAEVFGSAHVDLPKINSAKYCKRLRKTLSRVSGTSPDCERDEAEAQAWLRLTLPTPGWRGIVHRRPAKCAPTAQRDGACAKVRRT
ncbi:hypothetical protein [Rhodanobacter lindaniclasticus]